MLFIYFAGLFVIQITCGFGYVLWSIGGGLFRCCVDYYVGLMFWLLIWVAGTLLLLFGRLEVSIELWLGFVYYEFGLTCLDVGWFNACTVDWLIACVSSYGLSLFALFCDLDCWTSCCLLFMLFACGFLVICCLIVFILLFDCLEFLGFGQMLYYLLRLLFCLGFVDWLFLVAYLCFLLCVC